MTKPNYGHAVADAFDAYAEARDAEHRERQDKLEALHRAAWAWANASQHLPRFVLEDAVYEAVAVLGPPDTAPEGKR